MKTFRILSLALAALLAATAVFAGGSAEGTSATADRPVLVMVPKGVHPYYEPCYEGFEAAGERYDAEVEMVTPTKFELSLQVKVIEDLIARGVDGIAISALDDAGLISVVNDAVEAGITVITFDAPAPSTKALTYIGTDNETAGYEAGKRMAELMGGRGQLAILQGGLGATNLNLRTQGFRRAMAEFAPDVEIVPLVDVQGDFAVTVNKTEALLQTYPDLTAIFAVSAEGAPGAATVVRQQGRSGRILIAGFDDLKDTLEGIRDGTVSFCLVQKTFNMGWLSVEKLLAAINGEELPEVIDTGILAVDSSNVDTYMEDMRKEFAGQ